MTLRTLVSVLAFALPLAAPLTSQAQEADMPPTIIGHIEGGKVYVSPTGTFKIEIPVLPELGGRITDTDYVVTFQDDYTTHCSIACFGMDATLRWEEDTRGRKDFLTYFFADAVMGDFQNRFPGATIESARYRPSLQGGGMFAFTLLPGGTMFANRVMLAADEKPPVAKRGNLLFVKNQHVFVISIELAEKVLDRSTWNKTPEEENEILTKRLVDIVQKMVFTPPAEKAK
ncbi:MAG TPA: hypothetical protein VFT72_04325 [Opitutaceae bacterium]|nr:hypothetical protein [Opitutaceae bacterium]